MRVGIVGGEERVEDTHGGVDWAVLRRTVRDPMDVPNQSFVRIASTTFDTKGCE